MKSAFAVQMTCKIYTCIEVFFIRVIQMYMVEHTLHVQYTYIKTYGNHAVMSSYFSLICYFEESVFFNLLSVNPPTLIWLFPLSYPDTPLSPVSTPRV